MAKTKTKTRDGDGAKKMASSRKRSHNQHSNDDEMGKREVGENDRNRMDDEQPTASTSTSTSTSEIQTETTPSAARPPRRKKRKKASKNNCSSSNSKKPLAGMTISVSTLSDNTKSKKKDTTTTTTTTNTTTDNNDDDTETASNPNSYNEVCRSCKELGANVIDLVCKRVTILVCTEAAVKQATQRVRKAIKKNKPLVSVTWLEECQKQGRKVDFEEYRLDKKANDAIQNRENRLRSAEDALLEEFEAIPDSGWSEPKELGCCCVCHENGTTADCPWCADCNYK